MRGRRRIVVGISGASGAVLGLRVLELVAGAREIESHLVITTAAERTMSIEIDVAAADRARRLASVCHAPGDLAAPIASGSFRCDGMIVAPCSMRSLSAIAYGHSDNLLTRAADVTLKERRRLVLAAREAPLHAGHLEAMLKATALGAIVMPPVPAFYTRPRTLDDVVTQIAARTLDLLDIELDGILLRWSGSSPSEAQPATPGDR